MKKRFLANGLLCTLIAVVLLVGPGCSTGAPDILIVDDEGNSSVDNAALEEAINQEVPEALTAVEASGILYMREEEKLARDVYRQLYEIWGINTFSNIGESEQTHMDAMASLIDRYALTDPVTGASNGEFTNQVLQQLYDDLVSWGSESEVEALKVGAAIEEIDIIDIEEYVAQTSNPDIIIVYENLLKGSRNHLRSFVSVMQKRGVSYEPQYLTVEQFNSIVEAPVERGG